MKFDVHHWHCNAGEALGRCEYGKEAECSALHPESLMSRAASRLKARWKAAVGANQTEKSFRDWALMHGDRVWSMMYGYMGQQADEMVGTLDTTTEA